MRYRIAVLLLLAALLSACGRQPESLPEALPTTDPPTALPTVEELDVVTITPDPNATPLNTPEPTQPGPTATPSATPTATVTNTPGPSPTPTNTPTPLPPTVYSVTVDTPDLSTMAGFLERAALADDLRLDGRFTLFAPTNDAFDALDDEFITGMLADPASLTNVIEYHVVPRLISTNDLNRTTTYPTLLGIDLPVDNGQVAGSASVVNTLTTPTNGIIHVIDAVLFPPE